MNALTNANLDCSVPYDCPGSECCNQAIAIDPFVIYEDINEWNNDLHLPTEGSTEDYNFNSEYQQGFDTMYSAGYVIISCCHTDESKYMESPLIEKNTQDYHYWIDRCQECGSSDIHITLHRAFQGV